jgi:hypothetical protein
LGEAVATIASPQVSAEQRERLFFFCMALAIATTVVSAFGIRIILGITNFGMPWWVHVHAVSFMAWVGFYVLQNALVVRGDFGRHRQLGRIGAIGALWVCFVGFALTAQAVAVGRVPRFYAPSYFLAQNWLFVSCFAGLTYAGIAMRNKPDWHRRLMLCATLVVSIPGFARWAILLAPPPSFAKHLIAIALFLTPALIFDLATKRRVHPAYAVGVAAVLAMTAFTQLLAQFPPFAALAERIAG